MPAPTTTTRTRRAAITAALAVVMVFLGALSAGFAHAHSAVIDSDPAEGAQLSSGPERVTLTFNEELQDSFSALTVVGPRGHLWSKGDPVLEGNQASVEVGELGPVGDYTIAYRVTSADGHPVSGRQSFTLTEEGQGTPGPKAGAAAEDEKDEKSDGVGVWVFVVVGGVIFVGAVAVALLVGRGSTRRR